RRVDYAGGEWLVDQAHDARGTLQELTACTELLLQAFSNFDQPRAFSDSIEFKAEQAECYDQSKSSNGRRKSFNKIAIRTFSFKGGGFKKLRNDEKHSCPRWQQAQQFRAEIVNGAIARTELVVDCADLFAILLVVALIFHACKPRLWTKLSIEYLRENSEWIAISIVAKVARVL